MLLLAKLLGKKQSSKYTMQFECYSVSTDNPLDKACLLSNQFSKAVASKAARNKLTKTHSVHEQ